MARDTYRYNFKRGRKIVHTGITDNLDRREKEHQETYGNGHIRQVGAKVTRESALEWEKEESKRGKPARVFVDKEDTVTTRIDKS